MNCLVKRGKLMEFKKTMKPIAQPRVTGNQNSRTDLTPQVVLPGIIAAVEVSQRVAAEGDALSDAFAARLKLLANG